MRLSIFAAALAAIATAAPAMSQTPPDKGQQFLAENAKREGVKTTGSGLQYEVLTPGEGKNPKATDTVLVHYRGTLIDGTDSTVPTSAANRSSFRSTA